MIGGEPHMKWLPDEIARDEQGYLIAGRECSSSPACVGGMTVNP